MYHRQVSTSRLSVSVSVPGPRRPFATGTAAVSDKTCTVQYLHGNRPGGCRQGVTAGQHLLLGPTNKTEADKSSTRFPVDWTRAVVRLGKLHSPAVPFAPAAS